MDFDFDLQQQEIAVLKSIFADTFHQHSGKNDSEDDYLSPIRKSREEIVYDPTDDDCYFQMRIAANVPEGFKVKVKRSDLNTSTPTTTEKTTTTTTTATTTTTTTTNDSSNNTEKSEYIEYNIVSLPLISLNFKYPKDYPMESAPLIQISCCWLTLDQMNIAVHQLDKLFEKGELVIFKCIDWLKDSLIQFLHLEKELILSGDIVERKEDMSQEDQEIFSRVEWEAEMNWVSQLSSLPLILSHNSHENKRLFQLESHCCPVCYCDYPAQEMTLLNCNHFLCNECLTQTCNINIESRNLHLLKCTEPSCPEEFDYNTVEKVASKEAFQMYQTLIQQSKGYIKCTHCNQGWSFIDVHTQSTFCNKCYFSRCLDCGRQFHPGVACQDVGKAPKAIDKSVLLQKRSLIKANIKKKETEIVQEMQRTYEQNNIVTRQCRICPCCQVMIWKYEGCNKVCCTACNTKFCFICLKMIHDYSHFSSGGCGLFDTVAAPKLVFKIAPTEIRKMYTPKTNTGMMKCPRCRGECFRYAYNNHLLCFSCSTEMCFQCKTVISGTKHYQTSDCQQHGDK